MAKTALVVLQHEYESMTVYTDYDTLSAIIHSPSFEIGLIKILEGSKRALTEAERHAVRRQKTPRDDESVTQTWGHIADRLDQISINSINSQYIF
ncbi:hypothetical protein GEMRC1_009702 [Eukaryota sp. GEM-RC1]